VEVEYNQIGEECESRKESQRDEICMGWDNSLGKEVGVHEEKREQERELGGVGAAMEGEF
jgi:hypothetical protein